MPKDKKPCSDDTKEVWDPDEIPGHTCFLRKQNRFREEWEHTGAEKPVARSQFDRVQQEAERYEELYWDLLEEFDTLKEANDIETKQLAETRDNFKELASQVRILKTNYDKKMHDAGNATKTAMDAARIYQEAGQMATDMLIEYGDHQTTCNIWDLRSSGRILTNELEEDTCNCDWTKTKRWLLQAREKGLSGQLTPEEVQSIINSYK